MSSVIRDIAIRQAVQSAARAARQQHPALGVANTLISELPEDTASLTEALCLLAKQTPVPQGQNDLTAEDTRLNTLIVCMKRLVDAGAHPIPHLDQLLHSHRQWAQALLWDIAQRTEVEAWVDERGENPLHALARGESDLLRGYQQCSHWFPFPHTWAQQGRRSDGHTPLHVVWSEEGRAGKIMAWARGKSSQWMAYEVLEEAIVYTHWLLFTQQASWDDENDQGVRAGAFLVRAWDGGVGEWLPNVQGVEWIVETVEFQRQVELAIERRRQLSQLTTTHLA